ncbi:pilus assembly protein [Rhodobacteraceae bacterium CCMM004]|nr:pilus assembly protein [Rhodobacteraceae bacterium CCMM004]
MIRALLRALRRFRRREDGNTTIEFVILFTPMVLMLMAGAEAGLLNLRHVMLERGLDVAVRAVRLGPATPPSHTEIKQMICDQALLLPDCMNSVTVEMQRVSKDTWGVLDDTAVCRDKSEEIRPMTRYKPGAPSDLVLVRACVTARAIFPTAGLGAKMEMVGNGEYAAVATSVFVNEPL